jgi:hypothetical protein
MNCSTFPASEHFGLAPDDAPGVTLAVRAFCLAAALCSVLAAVLLCGATPALAGGGKLEAPLTEGCSELLDTGAVWLCGTLNPHAAATAGYYFAYDVGESCTGGSTTKRAPEVTGESIHVQGEALDLAPSTLYSYCLVATSSSGEEAFGQPVSFKTAGRRAVIVEEGVRAVGAADAVLLAQIDPNNQEAAWSFEYSTSETLAGAESVPGGVIAGPGQQPVEAPIPGGLAPDTTYYYQAVASNGSGGSSGAVQSFTTDALLPPEVLTGPPPIGTAPAPPPTAGPSGPAPPPLGPAPPPPPPAGPRAPTQTALPLPPPLVKQVLKPPRPRESLKKHGKKYRKRRGKHAKGQRVALRKAHSR